VLQRLLLIVALLISAARADALEYTDVYYNPDEGGWGIFLVQSDITQFIAFFIYDTNRNPTWYTAQLTQDATGAYTGPLIATTGTYFGSPWNKSQLTVATAGTASFKPTDAYHATLTYALTNGQPVTKTVERQVLTQYQLAGNYSGAFSGTQSGCTDPSNNDAHFRATHNLGVVQTGDTAATLTFTFTDTQNPGLVCKVQGPLTHFGRLYKMANAQFTCTGPNAPPAATVTIDSLHPTGQGIEGKLTGTVAGCAMVLSFAAVLNN